MKKATDARQWTIATILVVVIILAAAYFLLISPTLAQASETNAAAASQEEMNANTQVEVKKLQAQFEDIETYQAELEELQQGITTSQRYSDLQRLFASVAANHNVVITSLQFGSAEPLKITAPDEDEPAAEETPAASPDEPPATDGSESEGSTDGAAADPAPKGVPGLYSISVSLTITGAYNDVLNAVNELQSGTTRLVLITSVSLTSLGDSAAVEGASGEGLVTAVLSGETFVLANQDAIAEEEGTEEEGVEPTPSPEPLPQSTDNPLTPPKR